MATQSSIITRDLDQIYEPTGNLYESVVIISKRARQIAINIKEELNGKLAEFAGQHLQKGRAVYAEGRLRTNKWEDTGGQKHSRTEVVLSELQFVGQKPKEATAA